MLTIGGSDSGGCYGVQVDLRAIAALGAHGCCAITVVTAQNTEGVRRAVPVPVDVVAAQIDAVLDDLPVAAVKTGMLGRPELVDLVAERLAAGRLPNLVVDPVLVDRHGRRLFDDELVSAYRRLLPHAAVATPNRLEALLLGAGAAAGRPSPQLWDDAAATDTTTDTTTADTEAEALARRCGGRIVLTAGRSPADEAIDIVWDGTTVHRLRSRWVDTVDNAGSGDAFSAALAVALAGGAPLVDAARTAKDLVHQALAAAAGRRLGSGPGPIDTTVWTAPA